MKPWITAALGGLLALAAANTLAETRTVTFAVSGMTCATCPITVRKSLTRIDGVSSADVSYGKQEAVITFDDTRTNVEALLKATANAGYPSTLKK